MEIINLKKGALVLITGIAGFIGSNLAERCLKLGFRVRGIDNFSNGRKENIAEFINNKEFEFIEGDICDYSICNKICDSVDYVFHEAALGSVPKSITHPLEYTRNNILGTHNMMQASYVNNVKTFVYASSASVYGDNEDEIKKIGIEGNILSPYALSKKADEGLGKLYHRLYGLNTVGLRYFNVFGRRQNPYSEYSAVIPKFIKAILEGKEIIINGSGEQSRDFTYIDNVIEANLKACMISPAESGQVYNIACGASTSINELYKLISNILGKETKVIYGERRKGDIENSLADIEKTKEVLKYNPKYSLIQGLEETVKWYVKNLKLEL